MDIVHPPQDLSHDPPIQLDRTSKFERSGLGWPLVNHSFVMG